MMDDSTRRILQNIGGALQQGLFPGQHSQAIAEALQWVGFMLEQANAEAAAAAEVVEKTKPRAKKAKSDVKAG